MWLQSYMTALAMVTNKNEFRHASFSILNWKCLQDNSGKSLASLFKKYRMEEREKISTYRCRVLFMKLSCCDLCETTRVSTVQKT